MARYRSYGIDFKRQLIQEYLSGEATLHALARRYDISRNLLRPWAAKYEAGELGDERAFAATVAEHEARIAELERKVGHCRPRTR
jgi:transposase